MQVCCVNRMYSASTKAKETRREQEQQQPIVKESVGLGNNADDDEKTYFAIKKTEDERHENALCTKQITISSH